jgi:predicted amidohydrolase YtcJ
MTVHTSLCLVNGRICTLDQNQPWAEAVLTRGHRISFVGSSAAARSLAGSSARLVDLEGRLVLPGLIDNHVHFIQGGLHLQGIDLRHCSSSEAFIARTQEYVATHRGKWISGGDWDQERWPVKKLPRKEWLDEFSKDTPIFLQRFDGHMGVANSLALRLAGISGSSPQPQGGLIEKDPSTAEPTGILKDTAMSFVYSVIPPLTFEERRRAALVAMEEARRSGITSVQDITAPEDLEVYRNLETEGKLTCRLYTRLPIQEYQQLVRDGIQRGHGSRFLKLGSLKAFADGSLGSGTALFFDPYEDEPTNRGLAMDIVTNGNLRRWALEADRHRLQLSVHAIGDRAIDMILSLFEEIVATNPSWDRRFRIEHGQHVRSEDLPRFAGLGVVVSAQPYHAVDDGVWAESRVGSRRVQMTYPFRSYIDSGVCVCFGSDWTVAPLNPLLGLSAAVTRRTLDGKHPGGWVPRQKVSVVDAVRCYTINNAYAAFEEEVKGSLERGKLADMVVLDRDIFSIPPEEIETAAVDMTILDGRIISGL